MFTVQSTATSAASAVGLAALSEAWHFLSVCRQSSADACASCWTRFACATVCVIVSWALVSRAREESWESVGSGENGVLLD